MIATVFVIVAHYRHSVAPQVEGDHQRVAEVGVS